MYFYDSWKSNLKDTLDELIGIDKANIILDVSAQEISLNIKEIIDNIDNSLDKDVASLY